MSGRPRLVTLAPVSQPSPPPPENRPDLRATLGRANAFVRRRPWLVSGMLVAALCILSIALADPFFGRLLRPWWHSDTGHRFAQLSDIGLGIWWYTIAILGWLGFKAAAFLSPHGDVAALNRRRARSFRFFTVAMIASGLANVVLKLLFGRPRPKFLEDDLYGFYPFMIFGSNSFPSGHAQNIATAAFCLWSIFPRAGWAIAATALVIGFARVGAFQHYPSDVVAGLWVGALVAWAVRSRFEARGGPVNLIPERPVRR